MAAAGKTRRTRRKRERTLGAALGWGVAATFGVGLIAFFALVLTPNTALNQLAQLYLQQIPISPNNVIMQGINDTIRPEDVIISTLSLFFGGLTFGRMAPPRRNRQAVLRAGLGLSVGIVAATVAFLFAFAVIVQGVKASQFSRHLILVQSLSSVGWILMGVLGTWVGVRWRDGARPQLPEATKTPINVG